MLYLNACIVYDLCNSKVQRFGSERRQRKEINLCLILLAIVMVFFLCHAARIIIDVYEFTNVEKVILCQPWIPDFWALALTKISHLTMIINSSVNFVVYCLVGYTFRRELCRFLGFRSYKPVPMSEVSRRPSANKYEGTIENGNVVDPAVKEKKLSSYDLKTMLEAEKTLNTIEESDEIRYCN